MKTPEEFNEQFTRWLDGTLDAAQRAAFESELERNPALQAEAEAMQKLGGLIRANVTMEKPVPHADFFNSQLQERIEALRRSEERAKARAHNAVPWFTWLRTRWALAGATVLVALAFLILHL